ncbi:hypothetical protein L0244_19195 [bacterium]|nr:hypothetical protein [bacterium]
MHKTSIALIVLLLISGCAVKEKSGEASRPPVVTAPVVKQAPATVIIAGPPQKISVSAAQNTLRCGEKTTITVTVKDAAGQNVKDHTAVEVGQSTNPPWRFGTFDQATVFTQNGVAQTMYAASPLPSAVQITGIIGGLFGSAEIQVVC